MVGRPELGTKCTCASCAERFYDLNRSPAVCPKCGATQPSVVARAPRLVRASPSSPHMSRRTFPVAAEEEAEPLAAVEEDEDEDADDATEEIDAELDADVDPAVARD